MGQASSVHIATRYGQGGPGVESSIDHPPPSSAEVKESVELYPYSTSGPSWPAIG